MKPGTPQTRLLSRNPDVPTASGADPVNDKLELDKRKAFILATVVYEYINTAEPVGSVTLTQKYNLGVSSATIRNEMAELEAGGYLVQPHTSAGRVPSDAGYRTYVDRLMAPETLTKDDSRRIRDQFREASTELSDVIDQTTRLLSGLSGNLAIAIAPSRDTHAFKHVQLIWLSARTSLAIVVTSGGVAAQRVFEWSTDVDADDLTRLSNALNSRFGGRVMEDVGELEIDAVCAELKVSAEIRDAVRTAFATARRTGEPEIAAAGAQNLLDQPEFHDLRKLRAILRIVEEQRTLYDLIADEPRGGRRRYRSEPARAHRSRAARRRALGVQRRHGAVSFRRPRRGDARDHGAAAHALRAAHRTCIRNGALVG